MRRVIAVFALSALEKDVAFFVFHDERGSGRPTKKAGRPSGLLNDLGYNTSANRAATFANREAKLLVHGNWSVERNDHLDIVAWHDHFDIARQLDGARNISCTEVELWTVTVKEWLVTTALFLLKDVDFRLKLGVRRDGARLGQNLTALNFVFLDATEKNTAVVTSATLTESLLEHLDTRAGGRNGLFHANDLNGITNINDATLDTAGHNRAATFD